MPTSTQYKIYDDTGLIAGTTTTYTAVAGDKIKLEVYGGTIRIYLNDVLKYTRVYSSTNPYPVRYVGLIDAAWTAHASGNHFLPPSLTGDWQTTEEYNSFHVPPTLGTFTLNTERQIATVTVTGNPGSYNVTGVVGIGPNYEFTADATANTLTNGQLYIVNEAVRVGDVYNLTLPAPLDFETVYYVKTYSAGAVTLSLTPGGATIDLTTGGAGVGGWLARSNEVLLQYANAQVIVPAFDVLGIPASGNVEMQPSSTIRWLTTYDEAQSRHALNYVTRSATGGTFDNSGLYTASATAGTSTITFSSNSQSRVFTVTVPIVMTPSALRAASASEVVQFTTTMSGTKTWSVTGGSLDTTSGATVNWTMPSVLGQTARIKVTNGTDTLYQDVKILESLPVPYNVVPNPFTEGPEVIAGVAEDGRTRWVRRLSPVAFVPKDWELQSNGLTPAQYTLLADFVDSYLASGVEFFFTDYVLSSTREIAVVDSQIKGEAAGDCLFNASLRVRRA